MDTDHVRAIGADHVLAIDIGGSKLAAAIVSPEGELATQRSIETNASEGAQRVLAKALALGQAVARSTAQPGAVGLSTNGLTEEDRVALAPAVPGWEALKIPAALRNAFPDIPLAILNDVKAATLAELRWGALTNITNGLYVNLGTGIAAGIVVGGQLAQGAHGAAGEIGYIAPTPEAITRRRPDEALLEERIGGRGIRTWASAELGRPTTMAELMAARPGTTEHAIAERLIAEICFWLANVAVVLDPQVVVLGGGMMRGDTPLTTELEAAIERVGPFAIPVRPARFGAEASLLGAGAIALDALAGQGS